MRQRSGCRLLEQDHVEQTSERNGGSMKGHSDLATRRGRWADGLPYYFIVGIENSAPSLMPDGQRLVTVFVRV